MYIPPAPVPGSAANTCASPMQQLSAGACMAAFYLLN